jgi:hypothetical protein
MKIYVFLFFFFSAAELFAQDTLVKKKSISSGQEELGISNKQKFKSIFHERGEQMAKLLIDSSFKSDADIPNKDFIIEGSKNIHIEYFPEGKPADRNYKLFN